MLYQLSYFPIAWIAAYYIINAVSRARANLPIFFSGVKMVLLGVPYRPGAAAPFMRTRTSAEMPSAVVQQTR